MIKFNVTDSFFLIRATAPNFYLIKIQKVINRIPIKGNVINN